MFESFRKVNVLSALLMVAGFLLFIIQLAMSHSFSISGVIMVVVGWGLRYLTEATREELNRLRLENIELRKKLEERN